MKRIPLLIALWAVASGLAAQTPSFPTAEGFGSGATGGRGGQVVEVTTLADDAANPIPGSFRWALSQYSKQPITVVFRVSGLIELEGDVRMKRDNVTIAGQTAPGDGICIRGGKVNFGGSHNLIIRHLRFRIGVGPDNDFLPGGSIGIENGGNWIIDHCTFGWSGEENMTIYDNQLTTVQWCIVHEGLYDAGHGKGVRSYGTQWGGESATYHHNLLAHNKSRSPRFNGARSNDHQVLIDYVNNVNYNWGNQNSCYGADFDSNGQWQHINFVNNYYKPGPARPGDQRSYFVCSSFSAQTTEQITEWWMSGNYMEGSYASSNNYNKNNYNGLDASAYTDKGVAKNKLIAAQRFEVPYTLKTETAAQAYQSVLAGAGAFPRDAVDARIVSEVRNGTATKRGSVSNVAPGIIDLPADAGGYPSYSTYNTITDADHDGMDDAWETAHGLNPADAADRNIVLRSGYTALEAYLNSLCGEYIPLEPAEYVAVSWEVVPAEAGAVTAASEAPYLVDTTLCLTAERRFGYRFTQWEDADGQVLSTEPVLVYSTGRSEGRLKAVFEPCPVYTVSPRVEVEGKGYGPVPANILILEPNLHDNRYEEGETPTVSVRLYPFYEMGQWEDGSLDLERSLVVNGPMEPVLTLRQKPLLMAWTFTSGSTSEAAAELYRDLGGFGTMYLMDAAGGSYTWKKTEPGCYSPVAATVGRAVSDKCFFLAELSTERDARLRLESRLKLSGYGYRVQTLQYSTDGYDFTELARVDMGQVDRWVELSVNLPEEACEQDFLQLRWIPDYSSALIGRSLTGTDGTTLSDVYLLPYAPDALPVTSAEAGRRECFDMLGRPVSEPLSPGFYLVREGGRTGKYFLK